VLHVTLRQLLLLLLLPVLFISLVQHAHCLLVGMPDASAAAASIGVPSSSSSLLLLLLLLKPVQLTLLLLLPPAARTCMLSRCASTAMSLPASTARRMHLASSAVKRSMLSLLGASQLPQLLLQQQQQQQHDAKQRC
jgi:hypothetical protein